MFTLGAGFEYFQLIIYTVIDARVITYFEMEIIVVVTAAPMSAIEFISTFETDGGGDGPVFMVCKNGYQFVCDGFEKIQC